MKLLYAHMLLCLAFSLLPSAFAKADGQIEDCLKETIGSAPDIMTVGEIRAACIQPAVESDQTLVKERKRGETELFGDEFSILLHRENYILPVTHNNRDGSFDALIGEARELDDLEMKFQLSFKTVLLSHLPLFDGQLYAAYTNQSHWQAYNSVASRPFRETDHQPEIFIDFPSDWSAGGWQLNNLRFGLNHQSNGRAGLASRSWNRTFGELEFSTKHSEISLRTWLRISDDDENPGIDRFLGNFQLKGLHRLGKHQLHWSARQSLNKDGKGALELGWSRRIGGREDLRLYLQYFDGYGESLIDYNRNSQRIGLGFKIGTN